jgi:hypothetical protein
MPTIPLDVWISISERLPWEGPVKLIYRNTLKELPCADPKVTLFTVLSVVAHEIDGEVLNVLGGLAKVAINLGIIGPPASGKTSIPVHVLSRLGVKRVGSRSSPEGIGRVLSEEGAVVHLCDEVQQVFRGRRKDTYVGDLVDLWKSAFIRAPLTMARRSGRKSIDIPSSAKLTVIWTATEDDLEKVSEVIDTALLRRFLILRTTARVDPLIKGEEGDWDEVKACMKFVSSFKWRFKVEVDDDVRKFRDDVASIIKDFELSKMVLSEYGVRIACVLAIDRVVSDLLKEVRKRLRNSVLVTTDGVYDNLMQVFQEVVIKRFNELINRSSTTPSTTDDKALVSSSTTDASKPLIVEKVYRGGYEEGRIHIADIISSSTGETLGLLKYVEVMAKILLKFVEASVEGRSQGIEELINFMEKGVWRSPTFSSENMNFIDVYVPQEYVILGITLTALALIDTSEFVKWFGWDENWLYFVKKCYELGEKFGEFNIRTMAMYMKRIGRYSTIKEYIERALDAGLIEIGKCEDIKNIIRCWFRISPSSSI